MTLPIWSQTDFNTIFTPLTRLADAFAPRAQAIPAMTVLLHPGHVFNGIALAEAGAYLTGDIAAGSAVISNPSTLTGLRIGLQVDGLGIPQGTVISAIGSNTVTLSANATATLAANPLSALQVTPAFIAPVTNPRIDRIVMDQSTGLLSVVAGTEATTPAAPAIPAGQVPVAQVRLAPGDTAITTVMITDERDAPRLGHGYRATDTETGASYSYLATDHYRLKLRSNSGAAMVDTLPGSSPGVMPAGWQVTVANADAIGILALTVGGGATLDGASGTILYVGPGQRVTVVSDGTNYVTSEKPDRCRLSAATSFYVATTGSDSNHGLTAAAPFATIQKGIDFIVDVIDLAGQDAIVKVADGSYTAGAIVGEAFTGGGSVSLVGNVATPANCTITTTNWSCVYAKNATSINVAGFKVSAVTTGHGLLAVDNAEIIVTGAMLYGTALGGAHIYTFRGGSVTVNANYSVQGNALYHWLATHTGRISVASGGTVTLVGTPTFAEQFAQASLLGGVECKGLTFSGSASGVRYYASYNAFLDTENGGAAYLPGSAAGSTANGGQYI